MVDDWVAHTPKAILAKNWGVNQSVFDNIPTTDPYILNSTVTTQNVTGPNGQLAGNASFVYRTFQHAPEPAPGNGGTWYRIDSTNFPVAKTLAATYVTLKPGGLRELHWHPNVNLSPLYSAMQLTHPRPRNGSTSTREPDAPVSSSVPATPEHSTSVPVIQPSSPIIAVTISKTLPKPKISST